MNSAQCVRRIPPAASDEFRRAKAMVFAGSVRDEDCPDEAGRAVDLMAMGPSVLLSEGWRWGWAGLLGFHCQGVSSGGGVIRVTRIDLRSVFSFRQVVDQSVRIANVATGKVGLVLDYCATLRGQPFGGLVDIRDRYFEHRAQRRALFDVEVDVWTSQLDHRLLAGDREAEVIHVKGSRLFRIGGLDKDVCAEGIRHRGFLREIEGPIQLTAATGAEAHLLFPLPSFHFLRYSAKDSSLYMVALRHLSLAVPTMGRCGPARALNLWDDGASLLG